jgi:hypothetical protein
MRVKINHQFSNASVVRSIWPWVVIIDDVIDARVSRLGVELKRISELVCTEPLFLNIEKLPVPVGRSLVTIVLHKAALPGKSTNGSKALRDFSGPSSVGRTKRMSVPKTAALMADTRIESR